MDNVIKQGYLKKGAASDNLFSGLIEKMTPRKWYMLVVRNRVPYFEQYERDVDVFSSTPTVSYDLSTCTSISRSMSQSARTATFYIVMPDILVELSASTREAMIDWCDALERTLASLGILKRDREEHVYSFCPAVSNLTGRAKKQEDEDDDEVQGAVGGAPAPPLPSRQQPPPLPAGHPSILSRPPPSPQSAGATPPPLPSSAPPPLRRSASPNSLPPPTEYAPPPPPHPRTVPPLPPDLPLPPLPISHPATPPPLPPGRPHLATAPVKAQAPPLPPGRSHSQNTCPPLPCKMDPATVPRVTVITKPDALRKDSREEGGDSDDESTDYSSDFVSGAFWEINRKIPVPTARRAVLSTASRVPASSASETSPSPVAGPSDSGVVGVTLSQVDELDEGYSDLKAVLSLKKSHTVDSLDSNQDQNGATTTSLKKSASADMFSTKQTSESMGVSTVETSGASLTSSGASSGVGSDSQGSGASGVASASAERVTGGTERDSEQTGEPDNRPENYYAPFPAHDSYASPNKVKTEAGAGTTPQAPSEETSLKTTQDEDRSSSPEIESTYFSDDVLDGVYSPLSEASSFPDASAGVPPLPPRLDSLQLEGGKEDGKTSPVDSNSKSSASDRPVPSEPVPPRPLPRKAVHPPSPDLPPLPALAGRGGRVGEGGVPDTPQETANANPPSIPPRGGSVSRGKSVDSGLADAPPLPARKAQSFRHARPLTSPPMSLSSNGDGIMVDSYTADFQDEASDNPPTVRRQHSSSGADATENHLRQRQRLDRVHSMHAVVSLKQSQAEILKQEMELPGVTVTVTRLGAQGIGLVDCGDAVCVAGWNQKDFPSLHGKFHIGDQVISICNNKVTSASMAQKLLKHPASEPIEMLVKRTPHAQVLAIRRAAEGQNIGIKRNGGTAEILYVDPNGLAAQNGLPTHAPAVMGSGRANWVLTEINSRPLSLFFKDVEIEHRLNAVGREITVVVQPSDYILELKKQLKKLKNYKNYIVS